MTLHGPQPDRKTITTSVPDTRWGIEGTRYVAYTDAVGAALRYAAAGWPVFPCRPGTKIPATRHGFHDAIIERDQIIDWWHAHPHHNIGIRTGAPGPDVLDIDVRVGKRGQTNTGYHTLGALQAAGLIDGYTAAVRTRNGGLHLYYPGTSQGCRSLRDRPIDLKATGGYVLAPPSAVPADPGVDKMSTYPLNAYRLIDHRPGGRPLDWAKIENLFTPKPQIPQPRTPAVPRDQDAALRGLVRTVSTAQTGNRNHALYYAGCRAAEHVNAGRLDYGHAWRQLVDAALSTGLKPQEVAKTLKSAMGAPR